MQQNNAWSEFTRHTSLGKKGEHTLTREEGEGFVIQWEWSFRNYTKSALTTVAKNKLFFIVFYRSIKGERLELFSLLALSVKHFNSTH